jgi:undecaprenyl-diphosphatase
MTDVITATILGIVEGVTEFLPISSTGHLIILNRWFSFTEPFTEMFDIVVQLGAVLAALVYFWPRLSPVISGNMDTWKKSLFAVIPALILGAMFGDFISVYLFSPTIVAIALIIGGLIIITAETFEKRVIITTMPEMSYRTALSIGLIQCLALVPGTSRSAATIVGGLFLGASRPLAAEFSFFLAIPTIIAASGYSIITHGLSIGSQETFILTVGLLVSFAVAWAVIKVFMRYIQNHDFKVFGYYRILIGILVIIFFS